MTTEKPPKLPKLPTRTAPAQEPPRPTPVQMPGSPPQLPSLDRSAMPVQQPPALTGPMKLDSLDAKCALQKSMANDIIPVKFTQQFPCGVHPCLNYTNVGMISFDLSFQQYRISIVCPECMKHPRP